MTPAPPPARRPLLARSIGFAVVAAVLVLAAHGLDRWAVAHLISDRAELLASRDWNRLLRVLGYWPTWAAVGGVWLLAASHERRDPRWWGPGLFVMASTGLAGGLAEVLKVLFRRGRPDAGEPYVFFPFSAHGFDTSEYGLPSSHAAVAFAAAFAIGCVRPAALWLLVPLAAGCAWTRVLAGQHFLSDVAVAACLGFLAPRLVEGGFNALAGRPAPSGGPA